MGELWNTLKRKFGSIGSLDVTRRALSLGERDETTGWRAKSYSDTTIQMVIATSDTRQILLHTGSYVRKDALGFTDTAVAEGDEIKIGTVYYEVNTVFERQVTPSVIEYYQCDLTKLTLHD